MGKKCCGNCGNYVKISNPVEWLLEQLMDQLKALSCAEIDCPDCPLASKKNICDILKITSQFQKAIEKCKEALNAKM